MRFCAKNGANVLVNVRLAVSYHTWLVLAALLLWLPA
jgi:hypothetical protein